MMTNYDSFDQDLLFPIVKFSGENTMAAIKLFSTAEPDFFESCDVDFDKFGDDVRFVACDGSFLRVELKDGTIMFFGDVVSNHRFWVRPIATKFPIQISYDTGYCDFCGEHSLRHVFE